MKIIFSKHSKERLISRGISQKKIREAINKPSEIVESYKNRKLFQKKIHGKILEVVTVMESNKIVVITAYLLK